MMVFSELSTGRELLCSSKTGIEFIYLWAVELDEETVGHKLDVSLHQVAVHTNQTNWKSVDEEFLLDADGVADDGDDLFLGGLLDEVLEHQTSEVSVQT